MTGALALVAALSVAGQIQVHPTGLKSVGLSHGRAGVRTMQILDKLYEQAGKPSLDFDFARYGDLHDNATGETSLVTFARPASQSPGTYVGADGLIKTAAVNLALYSEQFDNAAWVKSRTTVLANQAIAPDGKQTADKLIRQNINSINVAYQSQSISTLSTYTFSVYAKKAEYDFCTLNLPKDQGWDQDRWISVNLNDGTYQVSTAAPLATSVEDAGNGWYRISISHPTSSTITRSGYIEGRSVSGYGSLAGDDVSGIYIWGAQLEEGSTATPYIKTTSQALAAPRFDHDPVTGESLGLLVEEARTNLVLNSDTLATQSVTTTAAAHTLSFYGTGTVDLTGTHTATVVGTGAYPARTTLTFTPTAGTLTLTVTGTVQYAQLEAGTFPTSYIPTTTSAQTRFADVAAVQDEDFSTTNLLSYSESFTSWGDTNISRDSTTETAPDGQSTALQVSSTAANGTVIYPAAMSTSAERVFSIYLRRVTGTGDIQYTLDNGSNWTTQAITSTWQRYIFPKTTAAQQPGIRIVTSGDAIEMWGASLTATEYPVEYTTTRNLLTDSQDFERGTWVKTAATIGNDVAQAPDGTNTADKLVPSIALSEHFVEHPAISFLANTTYTFSCYVKKSGYDGVAINIGASRAYATFNLNTNTLNTAAGATGDFTSVSGSISDVGGGWVRVSVTAVSASNQLRNLRIAASSDPNNVSHSGGSYAGDDASGIYIWGAQLEPGTTATDYVRTVDTVGKAYRWYEPTEGTVYAIASTPAVGTRGIVGIDDNTANERSELQTDGTDPEFVVIDGGAGSTLDTGTITAYTFFNLTGAYKHNDLAATVGGLAAQTATDTVPTVDRMRVGALQASGTYLNGHIKRLTYWPVRQPDATLQVITQ